MEAQSASKPRLSSSRKSKWIGPNPIRIKKENKPEIKPEIKPETEKHSPIKHLDINYLYSSTT